MIKILNISIYTYLAQEQGGSKLDRDNCCYIEFSTLDMERGKIQRRHGEDEHILALFSLLINFNYKMTKIPLIPSFENFYVQAHFCELSV